MSVLTLEHYQAALSEHGSERKAAKALGLSRGSFNNNYCKLLGICVQCKRQPPKEECTRCEECLEAADKLTKEEKAAKNKKWREENPEEHKRRLKEYQQNNLPKFRVYGANWRKTSQGKLCAERCRAKRLGYDDPGMPTFDLKLIENTITTCENCGCTEEITLDHHTPLSKGGHLTLGNTNVLCGLCNSRKRDKAPEDFFTPDVLDRIQDKFARLDRFRVVYHPAAFAVDLKANKKHCRNFIDYYCEEGAGPKVVFAATLSYEGRVLAVVVHGEDGVSRYHVLEGVAFSISTWFLEQTRHFRN